MPPKERSNKHKPAKEAYAVRGFVFVLLIAIVGLLFDWWYGIPSTVEDQYVGRQRCIECHQTQGTHWSGSHHDLAMDVASPETVLADFNDASLERFGITSRMYRRDGKYFVSTEGPDGRIDEFQVKYTFGVEPLQQYMVEFDRPAEMPANEVSKLQVLRLSWDTQKKEWFYLPPPDVDEKLAPDDPLHWTGAAQNWNHTCADCHSTNLQKNFDIATKSYRTTFSEIDVSCEACHGPGSTHIRLAEARSLFWDRKRGYGLAKLKGKDHTAEVETCAPCHSRRRSLFPDHRPGKNFYNHYASALFRPTTYYPDGQILDEVYVHGSFIQSKMYDKGVRCTDCHDPHTTRVKHVGNQLCTSCHAHPAGKYDGPAHHRHKPGSTGSSCVECHMPSTPYMEVDYRRDHSLRVPRPDLSVDLGTPNACTGCHLDRAGIPADKRAQLPHYSHWLAAARSGDEVVRQQLAKIDKWAQDQVDQWYPHRPKRPKHFAYPLAAAWKHEQQLPDLVDLSMNRRMPAIARASALMELVGSNSPLITKVLEETVDDVDPQIRFASLANLELADRRTRLDLAGPKLRDSIRMVRVEAARILSDLPKGAFTLDQWPAFENALAEYEKGLMAHQDQAGAHLSLGILRERQGKVKEAARAYRMAIAVQPTVTGPRGNLAALLERTGQMKEVERLRAEELVFLERDARLAPSVADVQYRFGLALYLAGNHQRALRTLQKAVRLQPKQTDFLMAVVLLQQKMNLLDEAVDGCEKLMELAPGNPTFLQMLQNMRRQRAARKP